MKIGLKVRNLREQNKLTLKELADRAGISLSYLGDIEKERSNPSVETLIKIAKALDKPAGYFIDNSFDILDIICDSQSRILVSGQPITEEQRSGAISVLGNPNIIKENHIPILGTIRPGTSFYTEENFTGKLYAPQDIKADFALQIRDDSMIGAGINDKDIVLCKLQETASSGQIVAAFINESETTLRYFIQEDGISVLKSANPEYRDIELQPGAQLLGYAVKILKDPPPISVYREYSSLKEGHLQEWNTVIEKALSFGIKPSAVGEFVGTQVDIARKLKGK